jgi:hypothetical protein
MEMHSIQSLITPLSDSGFLVSEKKDRKVEQPSQSVAHSVLGRTADCDGENRPKKKYFWLLASVVVDSALIAVGVVFFIPFWQIDPTHRLNRLLLLLQWTAKG